MSSGCQLGSVTGHSQRIGKVLFYDSFSKFRVGYLGLNRKVDVKDLTASSC